MNLVADEGIDRRVVERLRQEGLDVLYIAELDPGIPDERVLEQANARLALLVTADKDFGELIFRLHRISGGVVLLRLAGLSPSAKADIVTEAIRRYGDQMQGAFTVLSPGMVRVRPRTT